MMAGMLNQLLITHSLFRLPVRHVRNLISYSTHGHVSCAQGQKQLLVDVSVLVQQDAGTGIQRVVRALLKQLLDHPPVGYVVRPIVAKAGHEYRYLARWRGYEFLSSQGVAQDRIHVSLGDIFLALDLAAHLLHQYQAQVLGWKRHGVKVHILVYDLLPILHPEWFNAKAVRRFKRWLKTLAILADSAICISEAVKLSLAQYLQESYQLGAEDIQLQTIVLGMDIESSEPSQGLPVNLQELLTWVEQCPTVLMVGTVEPRKGYDQALTAFEHFWDNNQQINLLIVGKRGWKTKHLQQRLDSHVRNNNHLKWLDSASDELLDTLYQKVDGVLMASYAEGYGLPLIEALRHQKPVYARDLQVFRDIAGTNISYFSEYTAIALNRQIETWLSEIKSGAHVSNMPYVSWRHSVEILLQCLGLESSKSVVAHDLAHF